MSQENVEVVQRRYEAVNRGDIDGVAGLLELGVSLASGRGHL